MTGIDPHVATCLNRLLTAVNAIYALQRIHFAKEFGKVEGERKREAALNTIERAVEAAAEAIGITPQEKKRLHQEVTTLRDQLHAANFTLARYREQIEQLTRANVEATRALR